MIDAINASDVALVRGAWPHRYVLTVTRSQDQSDATSRDDARAHEQDVA
jgi:hypothetical protein